MAANSALEVHDWSIQASHPDRQVLDRVCYRMAKFGCAGKCSVFAGMLNNRYSWHVVDQVRIYTANLTLGLIQRKQA